MIQKPRIKKELVLVILILFLGFSIEPTIGRIIKSNSPKDIGNDNIRSISSQSGETTDKNTIYVPEDYPTIQEAINAAQDYNTIYISAGTYSPSTNGESFPLIISSKNHLRIVGEDRDTTIIDAESNMPPNNDMIDVSDADGFSFESLTITGCSSWRALKIYYSDDVTVWDTLIINNRQGGILMKYSSGVIEGNILSNAGMSEHWGHGIVLSAHTNFIVRNNVISDFHSYVPYGGVMGIYLWAGSVDALIENNLIYNNTGGISADSAVPIIKNNTIVNNHRVVPPYDINGFGVAIGPNEDYGAVLINNSISGNQNGGIHIYQSANVHISHNTVANNSMNGIELLSSSNNTIIANNITNNSLGISLMGSSNHNHIHHNNLIDNLEQNAFDECINFWDKGYPSGGNYWSDYNGSDNYQGINQNISGSDGIGDTVYNISGGDNQDRYPLMSSGFIICGDANNDWQVTISDIVYVINFLFNDGPLPKPDLCVGDSNHDDVVDLGDVVYLVNYLFKGGPTPSGCCE
jgi:parallel beta-helix repeat protein